MKLNEAPGAVQKQVLSKVLTLNREAGLQMCNSLGIEDIDTDDAIDIIDTVLLFNEYEVPLYIATDSDIWKQYIYSVVNETGKKLLNNLEPFRDKLNELLIFRACYRYNKPVISDENYDTLLNLYTAIYPNTVYLKSQSYDDDVYDGILKDVLTKNGILSKGTLKSSKYTQTLRSAKTTSILPQESYEDTFSFIHSSHSDILFSLKVDGMNAKTGYVDNKFELALSRGRDSDGFDYTKALQQVIPNEIKNTSGFVTITGEAYIKATNLRKLNAKYPNKDLKTPKSAAGSLLVAPVKYDKEDFEGLHFIAHGGENIGTTITEKYESFIQNGFEVPPYILVLYGEIPQDFATFKTWLKNNILDVLWEKGEQLEIPSDGVVCEKIQVSLTDRKDQYSDANVAIKYEQWKSPQYKGIVEAILFEQKRVNASVVLQIKPVTTKDFNVARRVSVGSPAILIHNKIVPGSEITFERKSQAINVLVTD